MPICLEPDCSFLVSLDCDKDKPVEIRPAFIVKTQSMRGQREILNTIDRLKQDDSTTIDEIFDATLKQLQRVVIGWKNIDKQFSAEALEELLTFGESRELLSKVAYNQRMDIDEKKV